MDAIIQPPFSRRSIGPRSRSIALFGDSRLEQNANTPTNTTTYARGIFTQAAAFSMGALVFEPALNFGKGGDKAPDAEARQPAVLAARPGRVMMLIDQNDIDFGSDVETVTWPSILRMLDTFERNDIPVDFCTAPARNDAYDATKWKKTDWLRRKVIDERLNRSPRLYGVIPLHDWTTDRASTQGKALAGYQDAATGKHFADLGAMALGKRIWEDYYAKLPVFLPPLLSEVSQVGLYDATLNKRGALNAYPVPVGTGGTVTAPCTGAVASGMTLARASGTVIVGAGAVNDSPDATGGKVVDIALSGTGGGANEQVALTLNANVTIPAGIAAGSKVVLEVDVEGINLVNWNGVQVQLFSNAGSKTYTGLGSSNVTGDRMFANSRRLLRTAPMYVTNPGTESTSLNLIMKADCSGAGPTGTLRVRSIAMRVVG